MSNATFAAAWEAGRALPPHLAIAEALSVAADVASGEPAAVPSPAGLSPREVEVLRLLVLGRTDRQIAETLFISHRTAMTHVGNILNKLGLDSRTAAAAHAVRHNLD